MPLDREPGESVKAWFSRIVSAEIEAGKPQEQAVAIAYSTTGAGRKKGVKKMVTIRVRAKGIQKQEGQPRFATIRGKKVPLYRKIPPMSPPNLSQVSREYYAGYTAADANWERSQKGKSQTEEDARKEMDAEQRPHMKEWLRGYADSKAEQAKRKKAKKRSTPRTD